MQILYQRCAGIDVHKDQITAAARLPGPGPGGRDTQVRKFKAFYGVLREMTRWLASAVKLGRGPKDQRPG